MGQLGNQMFIVAATYAHALDNNLEPVFPAYAVPPFKDKEKLKKNYQVFFSEFNTILNRKPTFIYNEPYFQYHPLPKQKNMQIFGYFQSEKYFINHKDKIIDLFSPSDEILSYLEKYREIIEAPNTVAVHFRSYLHEDPKQQWHNTLPVTYYKKAMDLFPEDSLFVVFSNSMKRCKQLFSEINKNIIFVENEDYINDFYLMSLCQHNIIGNSSFSWWAAYINKNSSKIVIAPKRWFGPKAHCLNTCDLIPEGWRRIDF